MQPQPAAPPRVGLVAQARIVDEPDERWVQGFTYSPDNCGESGIGDPCGFSKAIPDAEGNLSFDPFAVWAGDKCSSFGFESRDWQERARRQLRACESAQIEAELWGGAFAQDDEDRPNRFLASEASDVLTSSAADAGDALACLEQGLAQCNCGQRGMIHATRQIVTEWSALNLVRRDGNQILTIHDTIVVPGAGYDGSSPLGEPAADGSIWAYATGLIDLRLSAVFVIPRASEVDALMREALNRDEDTVEVRAERAAAATWDGCCHFAVEIDADVCNVGGGGS